MASALAIEALASGLLNVGAQLYQSEPTDQAAHHLAGATSRFALALRRTVATATATHTGNDDGAHLEGELAFISVIVAGDMLLDAFAWAELTRRHEPLDLSGAIPVPVLWTKFLDLLDELPRDPMRDDARWLDVTLDAARDLLAAHRNPTMAQWITTSIGPDGAAPATLRLVPINVGLRQEGEELFSRSRFRAALDLLPWEPAWFGPRPTANDADVNDLRSTYGEMTERLVDAALLLNREQRKALRTAYRLGGFRTPDLARTAQAISRLLSRHLSARDDRSA